MNAITQQTNPEAATTADTNAGLLEQLRLGREERDEETSKPRNWRIVGAFAAGLVALAAAGVFVLESHRAMAVELATAAPPSSAAAPAAILQATGYVTARREATVSAQLTGTLTEVRIEEGERVSAGQVLAKLDDTAQVASLEEAQAQLNAAEALLGQYEAQLEQAQRDVKRDEELVGEAVSQQTLDTARTQVRTYTAQVLSQRRQVELGRATVKAANVQLAYTTIKAPFSGVITAKAAQAGEIVSPMSAGGGFTRTGIGTIVDMDSLEIEVDVNEAYLHQVQPDQPAEAVLDAYPDWNIPAHVIAIIPTADRSKATVKVRVAIDDKDPRILPDMGVRVSFLQQKRTAAASSTVPAGQLVPISAVVDRNGKSVVFTVENGRAHARPVTAGQTFGDLRLVEGIASGARVVRTPPKSMTEGARVAPAT
jgi:HlyD family secretion protein